MSSSFVRSGLEQVGGLPMVFTMKALSKPSTADRVRGANPSQDRGPRRNSGEFRALISENEFGCL